MEKHQMTTEDLNQISSQQTQPEPEPYVERPKSQRILAWICIGVMIVGIFFYCYWQIVPQ